jgi:hypothetical protein
MDKKTFFALLVLDLIVSSCEVPGDRAGTLVCPESRCSSDTPRGLDFVATASYAAGSEVSSQLPRIATGGALTLELDVPGPDPASPFVAPFAATGGDAITVVATAPPQVTVRGVGAGTGLLRIVDPASGALYDRTALEVADLDQLELGPADLLGAWARSGGFAVWAGADVPLSLWLRSADGAQLVDGATAIGGGRQLAWNRVVVNVPRGAGALDVAAAGTRLHPSFEAVDSVDDIVAAGPPFWALPEKVAAGTQLLYCFQARNRGRYVAGAPLQFEADENPAAITTSFGPDSWGSQQPGCVGLLAPQATVRVHAGGASTRVVLE